MHSLFIQLNLFEVSVLIIVMLITGLGIRFFIHSQRLLRDVVEETNRIYGRETPPPPPSKKYFKKLRRTLNSFLEKRQSLTPAAEQTLGKQVAKVESIEGLKETIQQQQRLLSGFLKQVEEIEGEDKEMLVMENKHLRQDVRELEHELNKKTNELAALQSQPSVSQHMSVRIEEVYAELEQLQTKMMTLEKQASRANNLAIELDDTREQYEQIHKDLQRKNEKLQDTFDENERIKHEMRIVEDKLAEANLHRQQLQRKTQFLQDLNADLQSVSDTNKKLNTELRRIGELESMLQMIAEERDSLLKKQGTK
ncbi:MAG: hypothetical protein V4676_05355 [Bacteroidota bacterium]